MSHPVWVCGLKHSGHSEDYEDNRVTPCMGVWIETITDNIRYTTF